MFTGKSTDLLFCVSAAIMLASDAFPQVCVGQPPFAVPMCLSLFRVLTLEDTAPWEV